MRGPRHRHTLPAPAMERDDWPDVDEELLKALSAVLREVVRALGFGRARAWLSFHGGVNVTVPAFRSNALGLEPDELARLRIALAPHLDQAGRVWMPKADKLFLRSRNVQIKNERPRASIRMLARAYNLSSKQIVNICRDDENERQFDLF